MIELPEIARPRAVAKAVALLADRERDAAAAEKALREARLGIESAKARDREEFAAARDAGRDDPGARHLDAARGAHEDAERVAAGEALLRDRAQAEVDRLLAEHLPGWSAAVAASEAEADAASLRALDAFAETEAARGRVRAARMWLESYAAKRPLPRLDHSGTLLVEGLKRNMSGDLWGLPEVVEAIRTSIVASTMSAQAEHAAEAERHAVEDAVRRGEVREAQRAVTGR
jgi:hypothetical protein